ncbi:hypothetical protein [Streptomyces griseoruber]|uniref:Uncharacterized protein n=1 Tax=Streptomyces griseoruber TaxID=1943 RepID=A0A124I3R7_9ACTN|nr:hypothetical protein [Streptomyces griseoruber]KUN84164.1 hypothetical protein AQJ64_15440 [Streptomyces griseoruber]
MRPASRTVPTAAGPRLTTTLTTLTTLLAFLAVLLATVPAATTPAPAPRPTSVAAGIGWQPGTGPRVDDPCAGPYAAHVRSPYDHLGERPHPPDHRATHPRRITAAPAAGAGTSPPPACTPVLHDRSAYDRGRAPPPPPGT